LTSTPADKGVTLVEVVVSIATLAVLILALGQTVLVGQTAARESVREANILLGCQQVLEQVREKTVEQMIAEDGSTFTIRTAGPEGQPEEGGLISVDKDLNGDGVVQTDPTYREGRPENDLVRVCISFKDKTIVEKVMAQHDN
jgi:type II secretory pathway pseudopilin PulG